MDFWTWVLSILNVLTEQKGPEYPGAHVQVNPSIVPSAVQLAPFLQKR